MNIRPHRRTTAAVCALAVTGVLMTLAPAVAADQQEGMAGHDHSHHAAETPATQQQLSEASKAYEDAMMKMHKEMAIPYKNDVDEDFVRGMIPHHQGAIDQAEVLLKYSKNPRLRRLAGGIIAAQRREIRFMMKWLKDHEQGTESADMPEWMKNAPSTAEDAKKLDDDAKN